MSVRSIMIVGSGRQLYFLAKNMAAKGHRVVIVVDDHAEAQWLSRRLKALVVTGDGASPRVLSEAGAETMDVVLAATPRDASNLAICLSATHLFGVRRTLSLVHDPELVEVFHRLGVTGAFSVTQVLTGLMERRVDSEDVINLLPLGGGEVNLTELILTADSPVVGHSLMEIELPEESLVACIFRDGKTIVPRGQTRLLHGDRLVVMTLPANHGPVLRALTGKER